MTCYHPIQVWQRGHEPVTFKYPHGDGYREFKIPCGQCLGCRLDKSREWAVRCVNEASLYDKNCFLTLTYDDDHLPSDNHVHVRDMQLFFKRLRKKFGSVRYVYCGEYGENTGRPHYHALCFGFRPPDLKLFKRSASGEVLYRSDSIDELWSCGYVLIGDVSFKSAAYVARYTLKKQYDKKEKVDVYAPNGRKVSVYRSTASNSNTPFVRSSNRPGIGYPFLKKYLQEVIAHDFRVFVVNGNSYRFSGLPGYYRKIIQKDFPDLYQRYQERIERLIDLYENDPDNSWQRLQVREALLKSRWKNHQRDETSS